MATLESIPSDAKICANCRYLSLTEGSDFRCADPRRTPVNVPVDPAGGCGSFQISFAAAKALAFAAGSTAAQDCAEIWEETMRRHLSSADGKAHAS